jgi:hypothetical protein
MIVIRIDQVEIGHSRLEQREQFIDLDSRFEVVNKKTNL